MNKKIQHIKTLLCGLIFLPHIVHAEDPKQQAMTTAGKIAYAAGSIAAGAVLVPVAFIALRVERAFSLQNAAREKDKKNINDIQSSPALKDAHKEFKESVVSLGNHKSRVAELAEALAEKNPELSTKLRIASRVMTDLETYATRPDSSLKIVELIDEQDDETANSKAKTFFDDIRSEIATADVTSDQVAAVDAMGREVTTATLRARAFRSRQIGNIEQLKKAQRDYDASSGFAKHYADAESSLRNESQSKDPSNIFKKLDSKGVIIIGIAGVVVATIYKNT